MPGHMTVHVGRSTVFTNWAGYATTTRRVQHIQRAPDLEMYRVSRLLRRSRVGSKARTKNMINTALEIERLRRWTYFICHTPFFLNIIDYSPTLGSWHAISNAFPFMLLLCTDTWHVKALQSWFSVSYPGGCIACACTPGVLRGAPNLKEGRKRKKQGKGENKRERKGEKGRERKYAKEKEKREKIRRK